MASTLAASSGSPKPNPFLQLDYLYTPSTDVAADARLFTEVLGGRLAFAVEGMGARVAMVELTDGPPHVLLTDHLEGDRAVYIYRVDNLSRATAALKKRGLKGERRLEIPMGPCSSFTTPAGHLRDQRGREDRSPRAGCEPKPRHADGLSRRRVVQAGSQTRRPRQRGHEWPRQLVDRRCCVHPPVAPARRRRDSHRAGRRWSRRFHGNRQAHR